MEGITEYQTLEPAYEIESFNFATIGGVYDDGVTLIFDGQPEPSEKHYKVNTSIIFEAGQRVKIIKDSGTYVVEYAVGNPGEDVGGGGSGVADNALKLGGKTEAQLSVLNAAQLGGKTEANLSVNQAARGTRLINYYNSNTAYDIQFSYNGSALQIRFGSSSAWRSVALA